MRILHVIPTLKKGGAERLALNICTELKKRPGIEVYLIALYSQNHYEFLSERLNYIVISAKVTPSITGNMVADVQELQTAVDELRPDVVHSHLWESEIVLSQVSFPDVKFVSHFHSQTEQIRKTYFPLSKEHITHRYERQIVVRAYKQRNQSFVAISKLTEVYAIKNLPHSLSKNVRLLPNAVNVRDFINTHSDKVFEDGKFRLVSVGRLDANKNHQFLIDVVDLLVRRGINSTLTVLGEGGFRERLVRKVAEKNLDDRIFFRGNMDNIAPVLWDSDVYVHSAKSEALGLTMIEAMAAGLPVVCLDGGGNRDLIINGKNGFILNAENVEQFTDKVELLYNNRLLLKNVSGFASQFASQFDIIPYTDELLKIYSS